MEGEWELSIWPAQYFGNPTWTQIEDILTGMPISPDEVREVSLNAPDRKGLIVYGGDNSRYLVLYFPDDSGTTSFVLTDPTLTGPRVKLSMSHPNDWPSKWCVHLPLVLKVFKHFYKTGQVP